MPKNNLIYLVSFDTEGCRGARTMAKLLTSSLLKTLWSGDIIVFRNYPQPLFPVERKGLEEIFIETPNWNLNSPDDVTGCLLESLSWRFKARKLIDSSKYKKICYLDSDCLALRNIDHLFTPNTDILLQRERGRSIKDPVFSGYLSDIESNSLNLDGVNAGSIAIQGSIFQEFMAEWEHIYNLTPAQHSKFRDQTALNRLLLDTDLNTKPFERGEIRFPFHIDLKYQDYREGALVHMVGESQDRKIDLAFGLYMSTFYNDGKGLFLDFLEI